MRAPPPGCFAKRGCNRLKTKERSAKTSAKRVPRGAKLLKGKEKVANEEFLEGWERSWEKKEVVKGKRVPTTAGKRNLLKINGLGGMGVFGLGRERDPASWRGKKRGHGQRNLR